jgi:hypothetical protein
MNNTEFLYLIRKVRLLLLIIFVVTFGLSAYLYTPYVLQYTAESSFYIPTENVLNPPGKQSSKFDYYDQNSAQQLINHLAFSTDMMNFLINKFHLYRHYKIDTTETYHYERVVRKLTKRISVRSIKRDIAVVAVRDRNNELPSSMANAMVWKLDNMVKQYYIKKLQFNLGYYQSFLSDAEDVNRKQNDMLMSVVKELREGGNKNGSGFREAEYSLYETAQNIQENTDELLQLKGFYKRAVKMMETNNMPSIVVIRRALPELKSKKPLLIFYSFLTGIASVSLTLLIAYFFTVYKSELAIIGGINNGGDFKKETT